jgi:23S rRNA pseudouridine2605 synthase
MRINQYLAQTTSLSRRGADVALADGRVQVNGQPAQMGQSITAKDIILLDGRPVTHTTQTIVIMLHKPVGYVCSRDGQGSQTVYELLPKEYQLLKLVGRLDKNSSGLLLLTNDGQLAHQLTHPSFQKQKRYQVTLDTALTEEDLTRLKSGVRLNDGPSHLDIQPTQQPRQYHIRMHEGRNRQIRRTFEALGHRVRKLHRTHFGPYTLANLTVGHYKTIDM